MDVVRRQIQARGIVQGVGFRPFVYRLARQFHLHGHVRNTGDGVLIEVEGGPQPAGEFLAGVAGEHPPLAQIAETVVTELEPTEETGFAVQPTREEQPQFTLGPPDPGMCNDCRREFTDPRDRRFGYPFRCFHRLPPSPSPLANCTASTDLSGRSSITSSARPISLVSTVM